MNSSQPAPRKDNLPVEVTSFVGRRQEIIEVKRLLTRSRLVTLTGPGGVGKTRLALRVASQVRRAYADGVWLAGLADLSDPELLLQTLATALGVQDASAQGLDVTLIEYLAGRHLLLVLDNCEHLADACAALVATILRSAPRVWILATSRQSLGMVGLEQSWRVPSLPVPALTPVAGKGAAPRSEAMDLFADRARSVLPDFEITADNGRAVADICRQLDGIPLALELAAVRMRSMTVEQIRQRLDHRFRLLNTGNHAAATRQQTLRALIDWSWEHCTPAERTLWARASVFSGGFDLAAAEQVCAGDGLATEDVLDLVDALVDKSILSVERADGVAYWRMLETIRQYAHGRLIASRQRDAVRRRHRDHFRAVADAAAQQWVGPDQVALHARLTRVHANLQVALEHCLTEPGQAQTGLAMAADLWFFFSLGHVSEGRRWYERALRIAPEPTSARAGALLGAGVMAGIQADTASAWQLLLQAQELADQLGDQSVLATARYFAGWVALHRGDLATARSLLDTARAEHLALGEPDWAGLDQTLLALAVSRSGDEARAVALLEDFLERFDARGELWIRSWSLFQLPLVLHDRRAKGFAQEGLRLKIQLDDRLGIGQCLEVLAWLTAVDDPRRAARLLGAAQATLQAVGADLFPHLRADHDSCVATIRAALGRKTLTAMFERGAKLTLDAAIAEALPRDRTPDHKASQPVGQIGSSEPTLTRREREVAELVADGLTNADIAARLVISIRTVEAHVEHIMGKLGFTSRTQIAAFITRTRDTQPPAP